jgi:hypothetical protein
MSMLAGRGRRGKLRLRPSARGEAHPPSPKQPRLHAPGVPPQVHPAVVCRAQGWVENALIMARKVLHSHLLPRVMF